MDLLCPFFSEGSGMPTVGSKTYYPGYQGGVQGEVGLRFRYDYHGTKENVMRALFHLGMYTVGPRAWLPRPLYQGWGSRGSFST